MQWCTCRRPHVCDETLVDMHVRQRMTMAEIGDAVGLTRERVRQRIRAAGVTPEQTTEILAELREAQKLTARCQSCGEVFTDKTGRAIYCSRECADRARAYDPDYLLDRMRELAERLGRTPSKGDLDRAPETPTCAAYQRAFGSLSEAQRLAGLPPNRRGRRPRHVPEPA